ncbi:hypothetical protein [Halosolutus gelatinilyticus]|nr:hypothetical protein [Halosolutus gelatinilyticus]
MSDNSDLERLKEIAIERYFDRFDEFQRSHSTVRQRLEKAAD